MNTQLNNIIVIRSAYLVPSLQFQLTPIFVIVMLIGLVLLAFNSIHIQSIGSEIGPLLAASLPSRPRTPSSSSKGRGDKNKINNNKIKNNLNSIKKGIIKGYQIQVLPDNIYNFYNNIYIRIFRVIGGISAVLFLSKQYLVLPLYLQYLVLFLALIQFIQITIISSIKSVYTIKKLRNNPEEFEVRNSPLDKYKNNFSSFIPVLSIITKFKGSNWLKYLIKLIIRLIAFYLFILFLPYINYFYKNFSIFWLELFGISVASVMLLRSLLLLFMLIKYSLMEDKDILISKYLPPFIKSNLIDLKKNSKTELFNYYLDLHIRFAIGYFIMLVLYLIIISIFNYIFIFKSLGF